MTASFIATLSRLLRPNIGVGSGGQRRGSGVLLVLMAAMTSGCSEKQSVAPSADKTEAAKGVTTFALDLYARLSSRPGNLFYSPASISSALGMAYVGARGSTAEEMAATLHYTLASQRLHPALGALLREFNDGGQAKSYRLSVANALWAQQGHHFLPDFLAFMKEHYSAGLHEVDFQGAAEPARQTINAWVEKQTEDKIKELLARGIINGDTRLLLTNAIYFKGDWKSRFNKDATREQPFHVTAAQTVQAPFMGQTHKFRYLDAEGLQALELPYTGDDLAMVVFLPKQVEGLADFEKSLSPGKLTDWLDRLHETEVQVSLPRFRVTDEFRLNKVLSEMGMAQAFLSDQADFSGMDGSHELFLSAVVHKAYAEVNEEGTEAAAATGVATTWKSEAIARPPVFRADHPFFFFIRDRRSGSILFIGRLVNPLG